MNYYIEPSEIKFGEFNSVLSADQEPKVFIDLTASTLEGLRVKTSEARIQLGGLGVANSVVTGSELITAGLIPDYNRDIHMTLED